MAEEEKEIEETLESFRSKAAHKDNVAVFHDGKVMFVKIDNLQEAILDNGARIATQAELSAEDKRLAFGDGLSDEIGAGLLGAGRSLAPWLSDYLVKKQGTAVAKGIADINLHYNPESTLRVRDDYSPTEVLRGMAEENPKATMFGEIAGLVAPALLTGGASLALQTSAGAAVGKAALGFLSKRAAAKAIAKGTLAEGAVAKGTAAAAAAAEKALAKSLAKKAAARAAEESLELAVKKGGKKAIVAGQKALAKATAAETAAVAASKEAAKLASKTLKQKVIGGAVQGATEGTLYGAGQYISRVGLEQEAEFNSEGLIWHTLTGTAFGGVGGAAFPVAGAGIGKVAKSGVVQGAAGKAVDAAKWAGKKVGEARSIINENAVAQDAMEAAIQAAEGSPSTKISSKLKRLYNRRAAKKSELTRAEVDELWEPLTFGDSAKRLARKVQAESEGTWGVKHIDKDGLTASSVIADALGVSSERANKIIRTQVQLAKSEEEDIFKQIWNNYDTYISDRGGESISKINKLYYQAVHPKELDDLFLKTRSWADIDDPSLIASAAHGLPDTNFYNKALGEADRLLNKIDESVVTMTSDKAKYTNEAVKKSLIENKYAFEFALDDIKKLSKAGGSEPKSLAYSIYKEIAERKKIIADLSDFNKQTITGKSRATYGAVRELSTEFKDSLIDSSIWGAEISRVAAIKNAYSNYSFNLKNFKRLFGTKLTKRTGGIEFVVAPNKLTAFFKNKDKAARALQLEVFKDFNESALNLAGVMRETTAPFSGRFGMESTAFINGFTEAIEKHNLFIDVLGSNKALRAAEKSYGIGMAEKSKGSGLLGLMGAGAMGASGGDLLSTAGTGLALSGGSWALKRASMFGKHPPRDIAFMRNILEFPKDTAAMLGAAAKGLVGKSAKEAKKYTPTLTRYRAEEAAFGPEAVPGAPGFDFGAREEGFGNREQDSLNVYRDYAGQNELFNAEPGLYQGKVSESLENVAGESELLFNEAVRKQMGRASFLSSKYPKSFETDPLLGGRVVLPTKRKLLKFERYYKAAHDPATVFADFAEGRVSPEAVEALRAVYPVMYQKLREGVLELAHKSILTRRARSNISTILGTNSNINIKQGVFAEDDKKKKGKGKEPPKKKKKGKKLTEGSVKRINESEEF